MTSQVYVVRDDTGYQNLITGPLEWSSSGGQSSYGGSTIWPNFAGQTNSPAGFMKFDFEGIAFAMYGNTAGISQDFQVEIDGNPPYTSSTTDSSPQNWMQWYQSPQLSEGTHSVNISGNRAIAFDVMIITPGPKTSLTGQTLLVDDSYEHISYEGAGWKQFSGTKYMSTTTVKALPIGNGTHQTSNIGDSLQFTYSGTRAWIFGHLLRDGGGSISLSYRIDNGSSLSNEHTYKTSDGTDIRNYQLIDTGPLSPGRHTLEVNLTKSISQPFVVDYIQYLPSFATLSEMPESADQQPAQAQPSGSSSSMPIGAIAGGVAGGVLALLLLVIGFFVWSRRRKASSKANLSHQFTPYMVSATPASFSQNLPDTISQTPMTAGTKGGFPSSLTWTPAALPFTPALSSAPAPIPSTPTPLPVLPADIAQRREEIQRKLQELQDLMLISEAVVATPTTSSFSTSNPHPVGKRERERQRDVDDLRRRIDTLTQENARLATLGAPPAYRDSDMV